MAEIEDPESASVSRPDQLRQCTVLVGENLLPDSEYPTGVYEFFADVDDCPETFTVSLIAVVEIDGKVVVAVPHSAWHRTVAKRKLPHNCLVKPVSIAVPFEDRTSTEDPPVFRTEKLWIGYLAVGHEEQVLFDSSAERADGDLLFVPDCPSLLPTADGLAAAVEQHFSFASAQSGPELIAAAPPVSLESRLTSLEATLANVTKSLQQHRLPSLQLQPHHVRPGLRDYHDKDPTEEVVWTQKFWHQLAWLEYQMRISRRWRSLQTGADRTCQTSLLPRGLPRRRMSCPRRTKKRSTRRRVQMLLQGPVRIL